MSKNMTFFSSNIWTRSGVIKTDTDLLTKNPISTFCIFYHGSVIISSPFDKRVHLKLNDIQRFFPKYPSLLTLT